MAKLAASAFMLFVVAGCGSGHHETLSLSSLRRLVLQPSDLPNLVRFDVGPITRFDMLQGPRSDPARFGRRGGWKADYRTGPGGSSKNALVVHSQVDLFDAGRGASQDLATYKTQLEQAERALPKTQRFDANIGDDSIGAVVRSDANPAARVITVAWKHGTVSASVTLTGYASATRAFVLRLVQRQDGRISSALG